MQSNANVLQVENIITRFNTQDGKVFAVNGISFDLKEGELLGVVGESGSGKSVTMMSLLKLLPMPPAEIVEGRALFENQDLIQMNLNQLRKIRGGKIGFIFQDPMTSLNPVLTIGYQLMEPMREHLGLSREEARKKAIELLDLVGIPMAQSRLKDFPHQFSSNHHPKQLNHYLLEMSMSKKLHLNNKQYHLLLFLIEQMLHDAKNLHPNQQFHLQF